MRVLVLGGTDFVGRHLVRAALDRGDQVTLFNRGSKPKVFPNVPRLIGDRKTGDLAALASGEWDVVVDVSGLGPEMVAATADLLEGRVGLYAFVSTLSVYADPDDHGPIEERELMGIDWGITDEASELDHYGASKALAEAEVRRVFPDACLITRAGIMIGAYDKTGRFTYWVRRMARGGTVLGPPRPEQPMQLLHARDHADFLLKLAAAGTTGVYDVVGPDTPITFADMLATCIKAAGSTAEIVWAPRKLLRECGIELPLDWAVHGRFDGAFRVPPDQARAAGLVNRPLVASARQVLRWDAPRALRGHQLVAGPTAEQEQAALARLAQGAEPVTSG